MNGFKKLFFDALSPSAFSNGSLSVKGVRGGKNTKRPFKALQQQILLNQWGSKTWVSSNILISVVFSFHCSPV